VFSYQVVNDRMTAIRNENEDLRSAAVVADESYQKVLADKVMLEMDLNRAKDDNKHLMQQVRYCLHFKSAKPAFFSVLSSLVFCKADMCCVH